MKYEVTVVRRFEQRIIVEVEANGPQEAADQVLEMPDSSFDFPEIGTDDGAEVDLYVPFVCDQAKRWEWWVDLENGRLLGDPADFSEPVEG